MTSHCTSPSASRKCAVIAGNATLTAMSSGASEAPSPTMARPTAGCFIRSAGGPPAQLRDAAGTPALRKISEVLGQERHHALPGLLGRGRVIGRALLVGEGVLGIVAIDLGLGATGGHLLLEVVYDLGCAPIVLVREVPLQGDPDLGRIGELARRHTIERHAAGDAGHARGGRDGERPAHAEA